MPKGRSRKKKAFDAAEAARQLKERGGFTKQRTTGREPTKGYMVSRFGAEKIVPGVASPQEIDEYRQANPNPSARPRLYVGGWHEEGQTYLDQSQNVRKSRKAQELGQSHAQRAVYNINRDTVRRVHHGGRIDNRDTLFAGHPEAQAALRQGNSAALRQQKEIELTIHAATAGQHDRHSTDPEEAKQMALFTRSGNVRREALPPKEYRS